MSDAKSDAYEGHAMAVDAPPENRVVMYVDAEGYAVMTGGWYGMHFLGKTDDAFDFIRFIRDTRDANPLPPEALVMPTPLWPRDADGRGLSVLEVQRQQHLTTQTKEKAA